MSQGTGKFHSMAIHKNYYLQKLTDNRKKLAKSLIMLLRDTAIPNLFFCVIYICETCANSSRSDPNKRSRDL